MSKWTPEPWSGFSTGHRMRDDYTQLFGIHATWREGDKDVHTLVAGFFGDVRGGEEVSEANHYRCVACVNALAGIEDPADFVKKAKLAEEDIKALRKAVNAIRSALPPR